MVDPDKPNKCKLGISKNPWQRIKAYKTAAPNCYFLAIYTIPEKSHEKRILDLVRDVFRVDREFVHCPPSLIQNIVECYFQDNNMEHAIGSKIQKVLPNA
jgi:hypothetical protein